MKSKINSRSHTTFWVWFIGGLLLLLLLGAYLSNSSSSTESQSNIRPYWLLDAKDESSQQDSLDESAVNRERLRQRITLETQQQATVDTTKLTEQINAIIAQNHDIIFGISIKDISTGQTYDYGNVGPMTAASVTKVLTAVDYLKQVELGNRRLDQVMSNGYTAQQNIEQMIVVSDNLAWEILNNNLTYGQMQQYAESIGLESYYYADNTISSNDTTLLFADLYERKLINESNTQLLLSYMERANYRDLIIPAVPAHDTVYHKAGEYLINLNDATIITDGNTTVALTIYTESTGYYDKARVANLMQQIAIPVLETFQLH